MESTGWSTNVLNILIDQAVLYFSHRVPYCIAIVVFVLCYFPHHVHVPQWWSDISGNGSSGQGESSIQTPLGRLFNCSTLQCQEGFSCSAMGNTSFCLPVCGRWAQYPRGTVVAIDVVIILSAAICVIASIAVLVLSCIQWKRMYVWLNVTSLYSNTDTFLKFVS